MGGVGTSVRGVCVCVWEELERVCVCVCVSGRRTVWEEDSLCVGGVETNVTKYVCVCVCGRSWNECVTSVCACVCGKRVGTNVAKYVWEWDVCVGGVGTRSMCVCVCVCEERVRV